MKDLRDLRENYSSGSLDLEQLSSSPFSQFAAWLKDVRQSQLPDANAFVLATVDENLQPVQRIVLLKDFDESGLVFFTNYSSQKAQHIANNIRVSALFPWHLLERQVKILGSIEKVSSEETHDYFQSRPRQSQIAAWASHQSAVIKSRDVLEQNFLDLEKRFSDKPVPTPDFWGGYRIVPHAFEFWQGRPNRLHDRFSYSLISGNWKIKRLAP